MRASFIASRRELAPFLVPHRFEGNAKARGATPRRLRLRHRPQHRVSLRDSRPYPLDQGDLPVGRARRGGDDPEQDGTPKGGLARDLFTDATKKGTKLRDFFEGDGGVLEWMLSSPGGFVVVDAPPRPATLPIAPTRRRRAFGRTTALCRGPPSKMRAWADRLLVGEVLRGGRHAHAGRG
jgi:hypothetical protein